MRKTFKGPVEATIREGKIDYLNIIRHNKSLVVSLFFITLIATGLFGFTMNSFPSNVSYAETLDTTNNLLIEEKISEQEVLSLEIDNLDSQKRNNDLKEKNKIIEDASNTLEEKILGALMDNLDSKLLSNRSSSVNSFVQEANNLIDLNRKLDKFAKSPDYDLIDLSLYTTTVKDRLARIPTLKPIYGEFYGYGSRYHPIYGYYEFHPAADQSAPYGTPIKAAGKGYVVSASFSWSTGNCILINHGNGFTTRYMHNSVNLVSAGDYVEKGDIIGEVGATGIATGSHLHLEIAYNGVEFNPQNILIQ